MKTLMRTLSVFLSLLLVLQAMPVSASAVEMITADAADRLSDETSAPYENGDGDDTRVLYEITEDRTENTKVFMCSDGTRLIAQYPYNVHFENAEGEYADYDNSLSETDSDENETEYKTQNSDIDIRISKKSNGKKLVRVTKDKYTLSWNYEGINKVTGEVTENIADGDKTTLESLTSEVIFSDVFSGTDLQYIIYGDSLKENIILNSQEAPNEFSVEYKYSGLTPTLSDSKKTVYLNNSENETVFVIEAPFMHDSSGEQSTDIYYEIGEIKNNSFTLTLTADKEWLSHEDRAFPVTVDPLIMTERSWSENRCDSAYVSSAVPNGCFGHGGSSYEGSLYVGYEPNRGKTRALLKFELPELKKGERVVAAYMYTYLAACYPETTVDVHKIFSTWEEDTVSWNTMPSYSSTVEEYKIIQHTEPAYSKYTDWDITELVNEWYFGRSANYGVMLVSDSENYTTLHRARFYSSGYTDIANVRPFLLLSIRNMSGIEDYYSFTTLEAGRGGTASVNNFNGNLVSVQPVTLDNGGLKMPVNISLVYNSNRDGLSTNWLGAGWRHNYNLKVLPNPYITSSSEDEIKKFKYFLCDADGTEHYFYFENLNGTEGKDEDGLGYTLSVNSSSTTERYTVTDKTGNTMKFNSNGSLVSVNEKNGQSIVLAYENITSSSNVQYERLKKITDGSGRIYNFSYNSNQSVVLNKITDPAGRVTSFSVSDDKLNSITYPDGKTVSFSYDSSKILTGITNFDQTKIKIEYITENTAKMVGDIYREKNSTFDEEYYFEYYQNETVIYDTKGREYKYQFNSFGQNTGIVSCEDGSAASYIYAPGNSTDPTANKVLTASKVQKAVKNYIKNPSFNKDALSGYSIWYSKSQSSISVSKDSSYGHYSKGSLKISKPQYSTEAMTVHQTIYLPAGTYTASAFISTNGTNFSGSSSVLGIQLGNANGQYATYMCEPVSYTAVNEWVRRSVTVTINEGDYIKVISSFTPGIWGTAWIDDIQLEEGNGVSSFNILENPAFTDSTNSWTANGTSRVLSTSLIGFEKRMRVTPTGVTGQTGISQTVSFKGKKGDVFSAGAWVQGDIIPIEGNKRSNDDSKITANCKLKIELYNGTTLVNSAEKDYNDAVSSWQFVSTYIVAKAAFTSVKLSIVYDNNRNPLDITGTYVLAEEYGQSYTYDKQGNLISSADVTGSMDSYGYSGNNLTAVKQPTGSSVLFATDEDTGLIYHAQTANGQRYDYTYDSNSNPTKLQVGVSKLATNITNGKKYYFLNSATGMALGVKGSTSGSDCELQTWDTDSAYQIWTARKNSDGSYSFYLNSYPTMFLDVSSGTAKDGDIMQIYANGTNVAQKFTLEIDTDGTYLILSVCSNDTCAVNGIANENTEIKDGSSVVQSKISPEIPKGAMWYIIPENAALTSDSYFESTAAYTSNGNFPQSEEDANGINTSYSYNTTNGQLNSTTTEGITTNYTYKSNSNQLSTVTSGGMTVGYTYENDRLSKIDTPTTDYTFTYDTFGRTKKIQAGSYTLTNNTYDSYGLLTAQSMLAGDTKTYTYDELDRVKTETKNGNTLSYFYGSNGELSYITDSKTGTRTQYEYDLADRIVSVKEFADDEPYKFNLKSSLGYTYENGTNRLNRITAKTELGENVLDVGYKNPKDGHMPDAIYSEWWNGSWTRSYNYDDLGRLYTADTRTTELTWLKSEYTYRTISGNRTTSQVSSLETEAGTYSYTYDSRGNISSVSDGTYTTTYTYDNLNQLTRENNQKLEKTYVYTYSNGNITSRKEYAYTTGTLGTAAKTDTFTYTAYSWGDILVAYNGEYFGYTDAKMNSFQGKALTWHYLGLLGSAGSTSFTYDTSGRRLSKTTGGVNIGVVNPIRYKRLLL